MSHDGILEPGELPSQGGGDGESMLDRPRRRMAVVGMRVRRFSRNYSIFVSFSKYALPMMAGALVLTVAFWQEIAGTDNRFRISAKPIDPTKASRLSMLGANYQGVDSKRQKFNLAAAAVVKSTVEENAVELDEPAAELAQADGTRLAMTAATGFYMRDTKILDLFDEVTILNKDDGHTIRTQTARVQLDRNEGAGDMRVIGQGPGWNITAESGFRILKHGALVLFLGQSQLILEEQARDSFKQ